MAVRFEAPYWQLASIAAKLSPIGYTQVIMGMHLLLLMKLKLVIYHHFNSTTWYVKYLKDLLTIT